MAQLRAGIVGAGIAGLSAALALRQAGYEVTLFEQAEAITPIGAALSLWDNAMICLRELGAAQRVEHEAQHISRACIKSVSGRDLMPPMSATAQMERMPTAFLSTRTLLQSSLLEALGTDTVRLRCTVEEVGQNPKCAFVKVKGEAEHPFDLVVVADGIRSPTGQAITGTVMRHAGYGGFLAISEEVHESSWPEGELHEYWDVGERMGIGDLGKGRRYWFYLRNEAHPRQWETMSLDGVSGRLSHWPCEIAKTLSATPEHCLIPISIHDRGSPRKTGNARIVCIGDAAHAMQPNLGQGACQAIEDAVALRDVARQFSPERVGELHGRIRLPRVRRIIRAANFVGKVNHGFPRWAAHLAHLGIARTSERRAQAAFDDTNTMPDYPAMLRRMG